MIGLFWAAVPKLLQPADVSWNASFKTAHRAAYNRWPATAQHTYIPAGNMRAPSKDIVVAVLKNAWNCFSRETVNSFISSMQPSA